MVWWISVSKTLMKQALHSLEWSFGRTISARFVMQTAQGVGGIFAGFLLKECPWRGNLDGWRTVHDSQVAMRASHEVWRTRTLRLPVVAHIHLPCSVTQSGAKCWTLIFTCPQ